MRIALTCGNTAEIKKVSIRMKSVLLSQENPDKANEIGFVHSYTKLLSSRDLDSFVLKCP